MKQIINEHLDRLCRFSSDAHTIANAIYNLICSVGHGKTSADNALHVMVEYEHLAMRLGNKILELERELKKGGEA